MIDYPSPNQNDRREGRRPDMLILHYTGMMSAKDALHRLTDPKAAVSAHYLIDEDGSAYVLVPEDSRAWHAGVSSWEGESDINSRSIGIELVNPGHEFGYRPFPGAQIMRLIALAQDIVERHAIKPFHILAHSDVAPMRKADPGELFPWSRLAAVGIGIMPEPDVNAMAEPLIPGMAGKAVDALRQRLAAFGYGVSAGDVYDDETRAVVAALQRHYRPSAVTGVADGESIAILEALVRIKKEHAR